MAGKAAFNLRQREADLEMLRNRIKIERTHSSIADARVLNDIEASLLEARERGIAAQKSKQVRDDYLRRCRLEVSAARASFEQDVKRHEAVFRTCAQDRERRRAEAEKRKALPSFNVTRHASAAPRSLSTAEQIRAYEGWEASFADFERSLDGSCFGVDDVPWPPQGCLVTGIRRGDSEEVQRQRIKQALLRWHPDKFLTRHASKLEEGAVAEIMERVSATLQRVQADHPQPVRLLPSSVTPRGQLALTSFPALLVCRRRESMWPRGQHGHARQAAAVEGRALPSDIERSARDVMSVGSGVSCWRLCNNSLPQIAIRQNKNATL